MRRQRGSVRMIVVMVVVMFVVMVVVVMVVAVIVHGTIVHLDDSALTHGAARRKGRDCRE
jgi:hypothetical protein